MTGQAKQYWAVSRKTKQHPPRTIQVTAPPGPVTRKRRGRADMLGTRWASASIRAVERDHACLVAAGSARGEPAERAAQASPIAMIESGTVLHRTRPPSPLLR